MYSISDPRLIGGTGEQDRKMLLDRLSRLCTYQSRFPRTSFSASRIASHRSRRTKQLSVLGSDPLKDHPEKKDDPLQPLVYLVP